MVEISLVIGKPGSGKTMFIQQRLWKTPNALIVGVEEGQIPPDELIVEKLLEDNKYDCLVLNDCVDLLYLVECNNTPDNVIITLQYEGDFPYQYNKWVVNKWMLK